MGEHAKKRIAARATAARRLARDLMASLPPPASETAAARVERRIETEHRRFLDAEPSVPEGANRA